MHQKYRKSILIIIPVLGDFCTARQTETSVVCFRFWIPAPVTVYSGTIDPDRFLKKVHEFSHMIRADIVRCLMSLQKFLIEELKDGNILQTRIIGTFSPSVKKSKGALTRDAMEISINYRQYKSMKKEPKNADLNKVRKMG